MVDKHVTWAAADEARAAVGAAWAWVAAAVAKVEVAEERVTAMAAASASVGSVVLGRAALQSIGHC